MPRSKNQPPMKQGSSDDFQTTNPMPCRALAEFVKPCRVWECAAGRGLLADNLDALGFQTIRTDILTGTDFLMMTPALPYDVIVTNPPFSLKDEFLSRAYILDKPFAFLLPLTAFEGKNRQNLYRRFGLQVIFLPRRVNFVTPSGTGAGSWFKTAWFTHGLNLPENMIFWTELGVVHE